MGQILKQVSKISGVYGQPGEEKVSGILAEHLPDSYVILNSPRVYYHGATFDIDHIVIGPNGIFVIETKNMQGTIMGGLMGNWVQERRRTGKHRKVKIGNPATQVNQYGKVVKSYLGSRLAYETGRKINFKIYPVVVFVHEDTDLTGMDYTKPGFVGRVKVMKTEDLADFIVNREGADYPTDDVNQFAELIVPENQRDQTVYFSLDSLQDYSDGVADRYGVFEEIGRGNFGIVYRGFDYKLDEEIAIKKLPLENQNTPNAVNRFYREAQIASSLQHENIVSVYNYYEKSGEYFIAMEMVDGQTLEEYAREKTIDTGDALKMAVQVCNGLAYAHGMHVIHRDLKPSNILVAHDGTVKITDFGIAKLAHSTNLTLDGTGAGTPTAMSPEQINGVEVTERSDIFSTGVLLYHLLTGKLPFDGDNLGEIVHKIAYLDPVPLRQIKPDISPDLEAVVLKALEKNPEDRFATAEQMGQALSEILQNGRLSLKIGRKRWLRYIPTVLRPLFRSEKRLFAMVTVTSLIIFISILTFQAYRDSRQLSQEAILTKQYGFNNDNLRLLYENPKLYIGLPVNVVGRVDRIIKKEGQVTQFSVVVNPGNSQDKRNLIVSYNDPSFSLQFTSYLKITGSLQNITLNQDGTKSPLVVADKVESIADPWSILAPSQYTIYPNQTLQQNGKTVELEKVEFSEQETRLFVRISNEGDTSDVMVLANPIGKQAEKVFTELSDSYRTTIPSTVQLQPNQEAREVVFLEPLDRKMNTATFILGSSNDILMGQDPYVFDVKW